MTTTFMPTCEKPITRTIAGHKVTLEEGRHYIASRPMGQTDDNIVVMIEDLTKLTTAANVGPMTYDEANEFLGQFNNRAISFSGRIW